MDKAKPTRIPLTRERIVEAALALVAERGLHDFSTRKLGERLGCEAMSIYHHFASKQHLMDALVDHAIGTVEVPPVGPQPLARLRDAARSYRAMARRFPALFGYVATHRLNTPAGVAFIEAILRLVRAAAPDEETAARQFRAIGYYLVGAGLDETAGYQRGATAAEPVSDDYVARYCPALLAAAPYFQPSQWDRTFEYGLDAFEQGFRAMHGEPASPAQAPSGTAGAARRPRARRGRRGSAPRCRARESARCCD
jgi:AcrR family transcriptional regulator